MNVDFTTWFEQHIFVNVKMNVNIRVHFCSPSPFHCDKTIMNCLSSSKSLMNENSSNDAWFLRNPSALFIITCRSSLLSTKRILEVYKNITTVYRTSFEISICRVCQAMHRGSFQYMMNLSGYEIITAVSSTFVETSYWYVITLMLSFIVRELLKSFFHGQRS